MLRIPAGAQLLCECSGALERNVTLSDYTIFLDMRVDLTKLSSGLSLVLPPPNNPSTHRGT